MHADFEPWLRRLHPVGTTASTYLNDLTRIEGHYGDLDAAYASDGLESIQSSLAYSAVDDRNGEANPSKLPIQSSLYKTLASYRSGVNKYRLFCESRDLRDVADTAPPDDDAPSPLTFGLEKDMQAALRANIGQLEPGLEIVDGGAERHVPSGFIDILARDSAGRTVVIELKAVKAPLKAQAQIAAYMGDIAAAEGTVPRGILVAPEFDPRLVSAARVMPTLSLTRYHYAFSFEPVA